LEFLGALSSDIEKYSRLEPKFSGKPRNARSKGPLASTSARLPAAHTLHEQGERGFVEGGALLLEREDVLFPIARPAETREGARASPRNAACAGRAAARSR